MSDPIDLLAKQRIMMLSAELETQLAAVPGGGPTIYVLRRLREKAAEALSQFMDVPAEDATAIRTLQNKLKRYYEFVEETRGLFADGRRADDELTEADREEMLDLLMNQKDGEEQAIRLGLIASGMDDG